MSYPPSSPHQYVPGDLSPDGAWRWDGRAWQPVATWPPARGTGRFLVPLLVVSLLLVVFGIAGGAVFALRGGFNSPSGPEHSTIAQPCSLVASGTVRALGMDPATGDGYGGAGAFCRWAPLPGGAGDLEVVLQCEKAQGKGTADEAAQSAFPTWVHGLGGSSRSVSGLGDEAASGTGSDHRAFVVARTGNVVWRVVGGNPALPDKLMSAARDVDAALHR